MCFDIDVWHDVFEMSILKWFCCIRQIESASEVWWIQGWGVIYMNHHVWECISSNFVFNSNMQINWATHTNANKDNWFNISKKCNKQFKYKNKKSIIVFSINNQQVYNQNMPVQILQFILKKNKYKAIKIKAGIPIPIQIKTIQAKCKFQFQ